MKILDKTPHWFPILYWLILLSVHPTLKAEKNPPRKKFHMSYSDVAFWRSFQVQTRFTLGAFRVKIEAVGFLKKIAEMSLE